MLFTAIVLGFAGSLHCIGMCSPLAMSVTASRTPFLINRIVYNGGRILTYGLLGGLVSVLGSLVRIPELQNILSAAVGSVLVLLGLTGVSTIRIPLLTTFMVKLSGFVKSLFTVFLQRKGFLSIAFMGMVNGLLPCGLTYLALTYCLTLTDGLHGVLFMLIFGVGTLPAMLGATSVIQSLIHRFRINFKKLTTVVMITMGLLLISRSFFTHQHHIDNPIKQEIVICR